MSPSPLRPTWAAAAFVAALGALSNPPTPMTAHAAAPTSIEWRTDFDRARAEAVATRRLLWVQFTGPWCHNCQRMERESFPSPQVRGLAGDDFVPVKLRSDQYEELALGYGLSSLPATVIVRPGGEVVALSQGFLDAGAFAGFLRDSLARDGRTPAAVLAAARTAETPKVAPRPVTRALAMGGYCPVSLVEHHKLVAGSPAVTAERSGLTYRFAAASVRDAFVKSPEKYLPVNGGRCPVAQVDHGDARDGTPACGVLYDGHLFLCAGESDRKQFLKAPERYAQVDVADRGFCPHCLARDGLAVRGRPAFSLTRGVRRYLFPDAQHRDAFRDRLAELPDAGREVTLTR